MRKRIVILLLLALFSISSVCLLAAGTAPAVVSRMLDPLLPAAYAIDAEPTPPGIVTDPNRELQPDTGTLDWHVLSGYYFAYFSTGDAETMSPENFQRYLALLQKYGWTQISADTDGDIQKITLESRDGECMLLSYNPSKREGAFYFGTREGFGDTIVVPTPDPNATPTPAPTETAHLMHFPETYLQTGSESLHWTEDAVYDYYKAAFLNWGMTEHIRFTDMLAAKGWTLIHVQGDNAADRQIHTFQSREGEYVVIDWDRIHLTGMIYYGTADRLGKLLTTPTPNPDATPSPIPTPTPTMTPIQWPSVDEMDTMFATATPLQPIPWPANAFPPYVPAIANVIIISHEASDYSGVSFVLCTQEAYSQYLSDMLASGWAYHHEQSNGTEHVYTGKTDLGEYLSIYWNSQTNEGKLYYGTKDSIPLLE